jgi:hypothetical protein
VAALNNEFAEAENLSAVAAAQIDGRT